MKNFKPCKAFAVIAVIFCITAAACGVFAAETYNNDGSTEVVARVESTTARTQPSDGQTSAAETAVSAVSGVASDPPSAQPLNTTAKAVAADKIVQSNFLSIVNHPYS